MVDMDLIRELLAKRTGDIAVTFLAQAHECYWLAECQHGGQWGKAKYAMSWEQVQSPSTVRRIHTEALEAAGRWLMEQRGEERVRLTGGPANGRVVQVKKDLEFIRAPEESKPFLAPRDHATPMAVTRSITTHVYRRGHGAEAIYQGEG